MARPREFDEERVLEAVMERFWQTGYEGTSAQDLVTATGLGRGSLYAAFTSKDGLFEQALIRYRTRTQGHVEKLRAQPSATQALRELMIDVLDADRPSPPARGCLATNSAIEMAGRNPRIADLVRRNFAILRQGIEEAIIRGQNAGEFAREADATTLALFVFNTIQGLHVMAKTIGPDERGMLVGVVDHTLSALR